MKSGIKTTEFWGRGIVTIIGLLVGGGVIQPEVGQKVTDFTDSAIPIIQMIIDGVIQLTGLITAFILQWKQGQERAHLKSVAMRSAAYIKRQP